MHRNQIWYQKYKIMYFKIFPIALYTHFSAENAQFWVKIARKKIQTWNWGIWSQNEYELVMRSGTDHNKFIFKIPYYLEFLSLNFFYEKKIIFTHP